MNPGLWRWIAAALIVFLALEFADGFISMPLRSWSSTIAAWLLRLADFDIKQHGTILETSRFRFDVVPACSGSTTLRVLIALALVWVGQIPGLSVLRRTTCIAIAIMIAIAVNGLRVATLVALGDLRLEPVEGIAHSGIGLCTFAIALGLVIAITDLLARPSDSRSHSASGFTARITVVILCLLLALPTVIWSTNAWLTSPLDRFGWIAWIAAAALLWSMRRHASDSVSPLVMGILWSIAACMHLLGTVLDIHLIRASGSLALVAGLLASYGFRHLGGHLSILGLLALGLPTIGYLLTMLVAWEGPFASLVLRGILGLGLILGGIGFVRYHPAQVHPPVISRYSVWLALPLLAGLALCLTWTMRREAPHAIALDKLPYLQGNWVGQDVAQGESTIAFLGEGNLLHRQYRELDQQAVVDLVITRTGGDRHRAHPPEYCLTGAGWNIVSTTQLLVPLGNGTQPELHLLTLKKDQDIAYFAAWFTDGDDIHATFTGMLAADTLRRLGGQRCDWATIRLIASDEAALLRFAAEFQPPRIP